VDPVGLHLLLREFFLFINDHWKGKKGVAGKQYKKARSEGR
jgi:hypothetical protein